MLTRLEVNCFKNLLGFSVNFGPFNCVAGLNGVGKSNIFDSIKFLSLLADKSIVEAALEVRESDSTDPLDIFWTNGEFRSERLSLAVEMIVPVDVIDDFGRRAKATSTFLRYEVELARDDGERESGSLGLHLVKETLIHINKGEAVDRLRFPMSAAKFRENIVINKRKGAGFISTHQDRDGIVRSISIRMEEVAGSRRSSLRGMRLRRWCPTLIAASGPQFLRLGARCSLGGFCRSSQARCDALIKYTKKVRSVQGAGA